MRIDIHQFKWDFGDLRHYLPDLFLGEVAAVTKRLKFNLEILNTMKMISDGDDLNGTQFDTHLPFAPSPSGFIRYGIHVHSNKGCEP